MNDVSCLIVSSSFDYATDLVCLELDRRNVEYFRINRDQFALFDIALCVDECQLRFSINGKDYRFCNRPRNSLYYRAPTFQRAYHKFYSINEQLYHSQWSSFLRNLAMFDKVAWMNNPVCTYRAENKMLQLSIASRYGLPVPKTVASNSNKTISLFERDSLIVKSIDTAHFRDGDVEMFTYTEPVIQDDLFDEDFALAPVCFQEFISPKTDIRVTYIAGRLFPFAILKDGLGIEGDWRKTKKDRLQYAHITLPEEIELGINGLMNDLGLAFGGIDLAKCGDRYYFIEVNPTGEWSWLQEHSGVDLCGAIVDYLD